MLSMKGNGFLIKGMATGYKFGRIMQNTKANGERTKPVVREYSIMFVVISTLANGKIIMLMVMGYMSKRMEQNMKAIGVMTFSMVEGKNNVIN